MKLLIKIKERGVGAWRAWEWSIVNDKGKTLAVGHRHTRTWELAEQAANELIQAVAEIEDIDKEVVFL